MATQFDLKEFEVHLQVALALPAAKRWSLERDTSVPLGVFCVLQPRTAPQESFKARLRWDDYSKPHSLKFVNMENGSDTDPRAWPNFEGSRPDSFLVCAPYTSEGHALHPEWAASPAHRYLTPDEPLVAALLTLQHVLDNTYAGRR